MLEPTPQDQGEPRRPGGADERQGDAVDRTSGSDGGENESTTSDAVKTATPRPVQFILKRVDGSDAPPIDGDDMRRLAVQGRITPQTPVRLSDSSDWQTAADHVDGLERPGAGQRAPQPSAEKRFFMDRRPWLGVIIVLLFFTMMFLWKLLFGGA